MEESRAQVSQLALMVRAIERSLKSGQYANGVWEPTVFKTWDAYRKHLKFCCQEEGVTPTPKLFEAAHKAMRDPELKWEEVV